MAILVIFGSVRLARVILVASMLSAPEHDPANGIGFDFGSRQALVWQVRGESDVGGKKEVIGSALLNLGVELAGGAINNLYLVAGMALFKAGNDFIHGKFEIGRCRNGDLFGMGSGGNQQDQRDKQQVDQFHDSLSFRR